MQAHFIKSFRQGGEISLGVLGQYLNSWDTSLGSSSHGGWYVYVCVCVCLRCVRYTCVCAWCVCMCVCAWCVCMCVVCVYMRGVCVCACCVCMCVVWLYVRGVGLCAWCLGVCFTVRISMRVLAIPGILSLSP